MLIEVEHLTKRFDGFTAVDDVSFSARRGEIVGLLGPNGAGKTTTLQMLLGLITPSGGEIRIFGKSLSEHRDAILEDVNFTSPYVAYPYRLTVLENLTVFAMLYNVPNPSARIDALLRMFGIEDLKYKPISKLSSGENTRVGLCKALMNHPKLLLLDEPTAYLDPEIASQVKRVLLDMQRDDGTTILYTSHNMFEVEELCTRIIFLHHGKVIASGSPIQITQAILQEERKEPSLEEVFLRVARGAAA
jgi:ABC-2 type transport system ATP-binding protein